MRNVYFIVSRDSVSHPGQRSYMSTTGTFLNPEDSNIIPRFPTLQDAVRALERISPNASLDGLRIERHVENPRPALEILEDLARVVEDFQDQGYSALPVNDLVAEAVDHINQESA